MTLPDILAQLTVAAFIIVALQNRRILEDMSDGNVERLERDDRATEARWWLNQMEADQ